MQFSCYTNNQQFEIIDITIKSSYFPGSFDFFGLNHYTTQYVEDRQTPDTDSPNYEGDQDIGISIDPSWPE